MIIQEQRNEVEVIQSRLDLTKAEFNNYHDKMWTIFKPPLKCSQHHSATKVGAVGSTDELGAQNANSLQLLKKEPKKSESHCDLSLRKPLSNVINSPKKAQVII